MIFSFFRMPTASCSIFGLMVGRTEDNPRNGFHGNITLVTLLKQHQERFIGNDYGLTSQGSILVQFSQSYRCYQLMVLLVIILVFPNVLSICTTLQILLTTSCWEYFMSINPLHLTNCRLDFFKKNISPIISQPGFFNLTSTFRKDSDIQIPYLYYKNRTSSKPQKSVTLNEIKRRKKLMVWFVSHCNTGSKREDYMAELSKYIPVDIYGKCGKNVSCGGRYTENCTEVSMEDYKFYFAAENSICREYFTGAEI